MTAKGRGKSSERNHPFCYEFLNIIMNWSICLFFEYSSGSSAVGTKEEMKNKLLSGFSKLKDVSQRRKDIFKKKERSSTMQ